MEEKILFLGEIFEKISYFKYLELDYRKSMQSNVTKFGAYYSNRLNLIYKIRKKKNK